MREIKFRGKNLKGEWMVGAYVPAMDDDSCDSIINAENPDGRIVMSATVGQYTGLKDKYGKEIYEGDIVICRYGYCGNPRYKTHEEVVAVSYRQGIHNIYSSDIYESVIIGNIHDNPELMNGGRNE